MQRRPQRGSCSSAAAVGWDRVKDRRMLIDHHCHIDRHEFASDRAAFVARAHGAGVAAMVTISTRIRRFKEITDVIEAYPQVYGSVGTHPHNAHEELDIAVEEIVNFSKHPKIVAIGEAGLDYFYKHSTPAAQAEGFRNHIRAARETGLPLEIHTRDADDDTLAILRDEHSNGAFPAILHCFTGGRELAMRAVDMGLYVSFSGVVSFKKRILVETDAPFLAPEPYRGKLNEPSYVVHTAKALALSRGIPFEMFARATTENVFRLFTKIPRVNVEAAAT
jgi:TatD DNase family protein